MANHPAFHEDRGVARRRPRWRPKARSVTAKPPNPSTAAVLMVCSCLAKPPAPAAPLLALLDLRYTAGVILLRRGS
jgi:hypothetical protein